MVISSKFLDALTPSSIRSITAKIRDKAWLFSMLYNKVEKRPEWLECALQRCV